MAADLPLKPATGTLSVVDDVGGAPAAPKTLPVRERERYELLEEHARGGLGRVWKARDLQLGRIVAIKEMLPTHAMARARFVREALVTARLEHPAIVPVHEAGRWPSGEPFYVMKLVSGRTLAEVADEQRTPAKRLALLPALISVVDAIAYAHAQGVIHRDLKPANLIVGAYGETMVIDWGLAKDLRADDDDGRDDLDPADVSLTTVGSVVGTPAYMAPEQARGEPVDTRADVYALGALLYFVLAGHAPHGKGQPSELLERVRSQPPPPLDESVSSDLRAIVGKAMAFDAAARYPTARELAEDLKRFQTGKMVQAHAYSLAELVTRWVRRHRALTIATGLFALLAAAGVTLFVLREQRLRAAAEVERDRADRKTLALLEQQGRAELAAGHPFQAAAYLVEAYRRNPSSSALRWLTSQAVRPIARWERALVGHTLDVPYVAYDHSGAHIITASTDGTARIWSSSDGRELARLVSGQRFLEAAVLSPDGRLAATTGSRSTLLYRADGDDAVRAPLRTLDGGAYRVWFTPDGRHVITARQTGEMRLIDVDTGELVAHSERHVSRIESLAFSPDGTRFATAGWEGVAMIWDRVSFAPVVTLTDFDDAVTGVAYSPDGKWLLTAESDVYLQVRHADTGAPVYVLRVPEGARYSKAWFSPDGQTIQTVSFDGGVRTWHAASGVLLDAFDAQPVGKLMSGALRPDGRQLVTAGAGGVVNLWRVDEHPGWRILAHRPDQREYVYPSEFSRDGAYAFTSDEQGNLVKWEAATGARVRAAQVPGTLYSIAPSGDGVHVAVAGDKHPYGLWDTSTGERTAVLLSPPGKRVYNVAVSADGTTIASACFDGGLRLYDASSGALEAAYGLEPELRLSAVSFRPDGRELAVAVEDGRVELVDRASGRVTRRFDAHANWIEDLEYSRDGARLVTAGRQDHTAKIWDVQRGELLLAINAHRDNLIRASFSPDGAWLATVSVDQTAKLWDARDGQLLRTIEGPSYTAGFSPDGRELLTTGVHGYAVIWDIAVDARTPDELAAFVAERVAGRAASLKGH